MNPSAALAHFPKITSSRYKKLVGYFSNLEQLWQAELEDFCRAGIEENIGHEFLIWREQYPKEKLKEILEKEKINIVTLGEPNYPELLAQIVDPPIALFYRGTLKADNSPALAIVGTRKMSTYGKQMCEQLATQLAARGMTIVSGLALGVDGVAHKSALDAKGKTLAVLGCGCDKHHVYPAAHKYLAEQIIASGGAIISEYPPYFLPTQYSYPARNRIIAGLSQGTLVIEAPASSGALITSRFALDYNREVMAIPHAATAINGEGCNNLLKMGAKMVTKPEDVLEALNLTDEQKTTPKQLNLLPEGSVEEKILNTLTKEAKHVDQIILDTGLDSPTVNSRLTLLEIKGFVKNMGRMAYIRQV